MKRVISRTQSALSIGAPASEAGDIGADGIGDRPMWFCFVSLSNTTAKLIVGFAELLFGADRWLSWFVDNLFQQVHRSNTNGQIDTGTTMDGAVVVINSTNNNFNGSNEKQDTVAVDGYNSFDSTTEILPAIIMGTILFIVHEFTACLLLYGVLYRSRRYQLPYVAVSLLAIGMIILLDVYAGAHLASTTTSTTTITGHQYQTSGGAELLHLSVIWSWYAMLKLFYLYIIVSGDDDRHDEGTRDAQGGGHMVGANVGDRIGIVRASIRRARSPLIARAARL